jgi:glutathione S-transferase
MHLTEEHRMRVYGDLLSGNCYKIKLLLEHLAIAHDWVPVDILAGETRTPTFLAMNPNGKIPVLELPDQRWLAESNAILNYLADGTPYLPADRWARAQVLQWQFFEQYSHEPYIAVARFIAKYLGLPGERRAEYEAKQAGGLRALKVMDDHLARSRFFVGDSMTIADMALFAYTHVAGEGGFDLAPFAGVRRWIGEIEQHPRHVPMPAG